LQERRRQISLEYGVDPDEFFSSFSLSVSSHYPYTASPSHNTPSHSFNNSSSLYVSSAPPRFLWLRAQIARIPYLFSKNPYGGYRSISHSFPPSASSSSSTSNTSTSDLNSIQLDEMASPLADAEDLAMLKKV
jgi:hypothetical protein